MNINFTEEHMHSTLRPVFIFLLLCTMFSMVGCGSGGEKELGSQKTISHIEIVTENDSFAQNLQLRLNLTVYYDDGSQSKPETDVSWHSLNSDIASITDNGVLTTLSEGESTVVAEYSNFKVNKKIVVNDSVIESLELKVDSQLLKEGDEISILAYAVISDGSKFDITEFVTWSSFDSLLTPKDDTNQFEVSTIGSAELQGSYQSLSSSVAVDIQEEIPHKIEIAQFPTNTYEGAEIKLRVFGIYSDEKRDISDYITWEFSNNNIVSYFLENNRLVFHEDGDLTLVATVNGLRAEIDVSIAKLEEIVVATELNTISSGEVLSIVAQGIFSDGTARNITEQVLWESLNPEIMHIGNDEGSKGFATALESGEVNIEASYSDVVGSANINVVDRTLTEIQVTLPRSVMAAGTSLQLEATGIYSDGSVELVTHRVAWSSDNASVISMSDNLNKPGKLDALQIGKAKIFATYEGIDSFAEIQVTGSKLQELSIEVDDTSFPQNTSIQLAVTGIFSDGSRQNLTDQVAWLSSDENIIFFEDDIRMPGVLKTLYVGDAVISVSLNDIVSSVRLSVDEITLEQIQVTTNEIEMALNTSTEIRATGVYSDGSSRNISTLVTWDSSEPGILSVISGLENYELLAISPGNVTVTATLGHISGTVDVVINDAVLASIDISPQNVKLANGENIQLDAIGRYSDRSIQNITGGALWVSSNPDIAFVSNEEKTRGTIYALSPGEVEITAGYGSTVTVNVSDAELETININYADSNVLAKGTQNQLSATGRYSNGNTLDISHLVTWQTNDAEVCVISNLLDNAGLLSGKALGECVVVVRYNDVITSLMFKVTDAVLTDISIFPSDSSIALGTTSKFSAIGMYSDGNTQNITEQVTWVSHNSSVFVDNSENKGEIRGDIIGSAEIEVNINGLSSSINIEVTEAVLESIQITPLFSRVAVGLDKQLEAVGVYSDSSLQNITNQVKWNTDNSEVAAVSNEASTAGLVTALALGTVNVSAELDGVTETLPPINVISDPAAPISISLIASPFVILNNGTDSTTIEVKVNAVDELHTVTDGTEVKLSITLGEGALENEVVSVINGLASVKLSSTYRGVISILAEIEGVEIVSTVHILSTDSFSNIIGRTAVFSGNMVDNIVEQDSLFGFLILNYSNREFSIQKFAVVNDSKLVYMTDDPSILNNNNLGTGEYLLVFYPTDVARENSYSAAYLLYDAASDSTFIIATNLILK